MREYAKKALSSNSVVFGSFPDNELRGVAELRGFLYGWSRRGEVALLVEPTWQNGGIGDALLNLMITAAQNRGIETINMLCLQENKRMQHLAAKHGAKLKIEIGDVEARINPPWPTFKSMLEEAAAETRSFLHPSWGFGNGFAERRQNLTPHPRRCP